jgi:CS domain
MRVPSFYLLSPGSHRMNPFATFCFSVGMLKRLPLNKRASDFASRAGFHPPPQFYGDVYLGRVQQKPALKNLSFILGPDTAPDAPWLQAATTQNLEYQLEMNHITGRTSDTRQPAVSGTDGMAVTEESYSWTQTEDEVELVVPLSANVSSKDVSVKFRPLSLEVSAVKTETLVSLTLFERVDVDACTWTLESGGNGAVGSTSNGEYPKRLVITMEKCEHALWPRIRD